ncbi:MAG: glycosyl hydrolase-related protein [Candidatus Sumerlaeota bacterium]|nr:glycosyl hydrolase-related protein [Candidatus Sumerlaeota bacterium]
MSKGYTLHVVSNTHWDREWRHSFQRMRMDLVEMMDRLLDICESEPDFKHYHLDSQTILLEDYLEIRPEKRELLSKHIRSGKILAGPWYTLPDMFLVSAEAMVRNLLRGHQVAASLGGRAMKVGYTPTSYGQTSQIAQVYSGFGIDSIMFYRGFDACGIKNSEYILEGADGTRILGIKFSITMTRFNFRFNVFSGTIHRDPTGDKWILFHGCDPRSYLGTCLWIHDTFFDTWTPTHIAEGIERAKAQVKDMATTEHLLLMDGFDASYPHPNTGRIVRHANEHILKGERMIHQSFPKFIETLKKSVNWDKLQVVKGERRTPAIDTMGTSLMQGVLTSHSYFKRANHDTQTLLEKCAEPVCSFAWLTGAEYPKTFLDLSWKYLLSNHGHDTICGASVDQIYADAMDRLSQSRQISHNIAVKSEYDVLKAVTTRDNADEGQIVAVFNPTPFERTEVVEAYLDFPRDDKVESGGFVIEDHAGRRMPHNVLSHEKLYGVSESGDAAYSAVFVDRYHVAFLAEGVPSMGYKCFRLLGKRNPAKSVADAGIAKAGNVMENKHLRVTINRNGTVDIADKATGRTFQGLGYFEDGGDAGTPWFYIRPEQDRVITTQNAAAKIQLVENKPLFAVCRVEVALHAPAALTPNKKTRVKGSKKITFVSHLRLTSESRYLEISTEVDTPVRDHRLRVKFPPGIDATHADAEGSFDVLHRPIKWDKAAAAKWIDKEVGIQPQQSFVDLTDGKTGLAIINRGLREYEVEQDGARAIALTLLRGVRYPKIAGGANPWADDPIPVKCQCMGRFMFDYAIYPHEGNWERGRLFEESRRFNAPMNIAQISHGLRVTAPQRSFLEIAPHTLVLSAMKLAESGKSLIVRLFNPASRKISGRITLTNELKKVRQVNLNEEPLAVEPLKLRNASSFDIEVPHKKIVTLELFLKR